MDTNSPTITNESHLVEATVMVRAGDWKQVGPPRCRACGHALDHESRVLLVDRLADARAYLEALDVSPLAVRVTQDGAILVDLDAATFQSVVAARPNRPALTVTTTDQPGVGMRILETTDGYFTLRTIEPVAA